MKKPYGILLSNRILKTQFFLIDDQQHANIEQIPNFNILSVFLAKYLNLLATLFILLIWKIQYFNFLGPYLKLYFKAKNDEILDFWPLTRLTWLIHASVLPSIWNPDKNFAPTGQLGQVHMVNKILSGFQFEGKTDVWISQVRRVKGAD